MRKFNSTTQFILISYVKLMNSATIKGVDDRLRWMIGGFQPVQGGCVE